MKKTLYFLGGMALILWTSYNSGYSALAEINNSHNNLVELQGGDIEPPLFNVSSLSVDKTYVGIDESVKISMEVSDDQSGVRQVSVYYKKPQTKEWEVIDLYLNPITQKYEGSIEVTALTESGKWEIAHILLVDHSGNLNHVNNFNTQPEYGGEDLSCGDFEVYGTEGDITPPALNVSSIMVDKAYVGVDESVKISMEVSDNQSGVRQVSVYYKKPQTKEWEVIDLDLNPITQKYEGSIEVTALTESGKWEIAHILLVDHSGNLNHVNNFNTQPEYGGEDLSRGDFEVYGTEGDITPPTLNVSSIMVDKAYVGVDESVKISMEVSDNQSGVRQVSVYYKKPQTKEWEVIDLYLNPITQKYEGSIEVTALTESGGWEIAHILLVDYSGNLNQVNNFNAQPEYGGEDLSRGNFEVIPDLNERPFPDVQQGKWYTTHIQEFVSLGFLKGYSDGRFQPQNPITRAEFVKIVNKAFGLTDKFTPVDELPFTDLDSAWKFDELKIALAAGYITPATEFRHNAPINRQEAAKIVGSLLNIQGQGNLNFIDADEIASWAQGYVQGLVEAGILTKNETYRPKDPITRAEAVKMLNIARGVY